MRNSRIKHYAAILHSLQLLSLLLILLHHQQLIPTVQSHGFLSTPRSRNLVAYQDRIYYPLSSSDPQPEDCPNCLNRGGTLAQCGILHAGTGEERNYDHPRNALGGAMGDNPQIVWVEGAVVDVEVQLTAHHKGHFEFHACPVSSSGGEGGPTRECFDAHPLHFVRDKLYGAVRDDAHPERAYVAPANIVGKVTTNDPMAAMVFQYQLQLPESVVGGVVLIQWYYVASNSGCVHEGYDAYDWPKEWSSNGSSDADNSSNGYAGGEASVWDLKQNVGTGLKPCSEILPEDGNGLPEQFWNCAEVTILKAPTEQEEFLIMQHKNRLHSKTVIGYYASWQWYDRMKLAKPGNMDFTKVTRVNFAFFQTDTQGNLWGTDSWGDPNVLFGPNDWNPAPDSPQYCSWDTPTAKKCATHHYQQGLIYQAHAAGAEVYPSLGGWSLSDPFPEMTKDAVARDRFAEKCIELIVDYGFDGLDLDWEYPGYEDHSGTPEDTENYNLLLRDLRMKLDELGQNTGRFYGLTAALPCGTNNIANINIKTVAKYLTEFNLMTYDFFGSWSPKTGTNAPLYDQDWGDDDVKDFSVDGCVRNWVKGGASPSAINIGLPFYGRSFLGAKGLNEDHAGNDKNTWFWDDGSPQYFNIVEKLPDLVSVRHEATKTQYAYKDSTVGGLVSYDDEQAICDKAEYCLDHDLNGFIIWELSGDVMEDLSQPLLDAVNNKLTDPALVCETLAYKLNNISGGDIPEDTAVSGQLNFVSFSMAKPNLPATTGTLPTLAPVTPAPTLAPATSAPTVTLHCPDDATGPRPWEVCTGYYYCLYGAPVYPAIQCPGATLYDETSMLCLPPESVSCSDTHSPTNTLTPRPTNQPTEIPTDGPAVFTEFPTRFPISPPSLSPAKALRPLVSSFYLIGGEEHKNPGNEQNQPTHTSIGSADYVGSALDAVSKPTARPPYAQEPNDTSSSSLYCPDDYTGVMSTSDCKEYFYCIFAVPHLPTIRCEAGKLFDVVSKRCLGASQVGCFTNTLSATMQPSKGSSYIPPIMDTKQPTSSPDKPAFKDEYIPTMDIKHTTTSLPESSLVNSSSSFHRPISLDSKHNSPLPESLTEIHHNELSNFGSSPGSMSVSSSPLPHNDDPFITFEISLSDSPGDIGWQLLSLDGTSINVANPPGLYGSRKPKSTVTEVIWVQNDSASSLELKWTILNLEGGYFKVYSGLPSEGNLLAEGGDFESMKTVGLSVTADGIISLSIESPSHSVPDSSLPNQDTGNVDAGKTDGNSQSSMDPNTQPAVFDGYHMYTDEYRPDEKDNSSMVLPILTSMLVVALLVGLFLIVLAHRKGPPLEYTDSVYSEEDDTTFGDWNTLEDGGASDLYADYNSSEEEECIDPNNWSTHKQSSDDKHSHEHANIAESNTNKKERMGPCGKSNDWAAHEHQYTGHEDFHGHDTYRQHANVSRAADSNMSGKSPTVTSISEFGARMAVAQKLSQTANHNPFTSSQPNMLFGEGCGDNVDDEFPEEIMTDDEQKSPDIYSLLDKLEEEGDTGFSDSLLGRLEEDDDGDSKDQSLLF